MPLSIRKEALHLRLILCGLVALAALLPFDPARAAPPIASSACAAAGTPTNRVVRYYLALDRRQLPAAYGCLSPQAQARMPYPAWSAGYAHTQRTRLMLADSEVPNGSPVDHVRIRLYAVDRVTGRSTAAVYAGRWRLDGQGRPARAAVRRVATRGAPTFNPDRILTGYGRAILLHFRRDVTGDRVLDDIYITSGYGCGSCHAQQFWVYSGGRLVFQQEVDDARFSVGANHTTLVVSTDTPNTEGLDSCCPTQTTDETWTWTSNGFAFRGQRTVHNKIPSP